MAVLATNYGTNERKLQSLLDNSHKSLTEQIKNVLTNLQVCFVTKNKYSSLKILFT